MLFRITDSQEIDVVEEETEEEIAKTSSEEALNEGNLKLHLPLLSMTYYLTGNSEILFV